jgi:hypothetical protein
MSFQNEILTIPPFSGMVFYALVDTPYRKFAIKIIDLKC